jgi:hypothetical protein
MQCCKKDKRCRDLMLATGVVVCYLIESFKSALDLAIGLLSYDLSVFFITNK